jgi:hypothetical protein
VIVIVKNLECQMTKGETLKEQMEAFEKTGLNHLVGEATVAYTLHSLSVSVTPHIF